MNSRSNSWISSSLNFAYCKIRVKKAKSSDDAELAKSCAAALEQIHRRSYAEEFGGGLKVMRRFGIAFCGKHCLVRMAQD